MAEPWEKLVPPGGPWFGGTPGSPGGKGEDGREVELRKGETHVQWRYEGESSWRDLVALADLKGEKGDPGEIPDVEDFLTVEDLAGYVTSADLSSALSGKADTEHTHDQSDVTGLEDALSSKADSSAFDEFAMNLSEAVTLALSGKANTSHTHAQSDITGLSTALSGKANTSHTHTASNITDFNTAADARIAASTTVVKTTGNQTVGGTKTFSSAPSVPDGSFSIAKVSGLQTALNGKV